MSDLISESLAPHPGTFDSAAMARGEPGLPRGFDWRDRACLIRQVLATWKHSSREGARAQGDLYLRRHYYKLLMDDDSVWTVYFVRQTPRGTSPRQRWFLYTIEPGGTHPANPLPSGDP